jgi:hypothetical protein
MMKPFSMVAMLNVRHGLDDAWRNLARLWQARRSEGRLQRLQRKVRRLERQCTLLKRRMHPNRTRDESAGFGTSVDADWC